jgi:hypothetical protein
MGGSEYRNFGKGKTAKAAFDKLVEKAQWENGHGGYSGTIAEKRSMVEFQRPKGMRAKTVVQAINDLGRFDIELFKVQAKYPKLPIAAMYEVYEDKWGPSLAIELAKGEYLFAGFASS